MLVPHLLKTPTWITIPSDHSLYALRCPSSGGLVPILDWESHSLVIKAPLVEGMGNSGYRLNLSAHYGGSIF